MAFSKKDAADKTTKLQLCNKDRSLLETQTSLLDAKITGLQADKEAYRTESDRFQALYVKSDQERVKAETGAPSRFRWFAAGVVTSLVAVIAALIAFK